MSKYNIEDGINFFEELYKSLDNTEDYIEENNNNNSTFCLISNEILTTNFVELTCGHKFNYVPLYNDIRNHKNKFNQMEGSNGLLKGNEIRCPYCRKKQADVLPYYEEYGLPKLAGVNWPSSVTEKITFQSTYGQNKCEFVNNDLSTCCIHYSTKLELDDKYYCYTHKNFTAKKLKTESLLKAKEDQMKAKEDQKKLKEEHKLKIKEDKIKLKEELKNEVKKNKSKQVAVNGEENIIICGGCTQIIKTGLNKGKSCNIMVLSDGLCKRHYNLKIKV
jgi:hypothetical protein